MILKIAVQVLCALMISIMSASEITYGTWYQNEAILKIYDGIFTVELLHNNSSPRSLNADRKGIVELNRDFARISSLESLSLEDNFIEIIYDFVFEGLPKLVHLSLARNRIKYLEKDCFQGLDNLEILNLDHNFLSSSVSDSINDNTLFGLKQLYLQHNQLEYINWNVQSKLCHSGLEHLYLANNSLRAFSEGNPICLNNLTHLYLEDNRIGYSALTISRNLPLEVVSFDGNLFSTIPITITPKLRYLSVARNWIGDIKNEYVFTNAQNLVSLILSNNTIKLSLQTERFINLPSLEHLFLDHNSITGESMRVDIFNNLTSLRSLDLTGNRINTIKSLEQFAYIPSLERLYLGDNQLSSFPGNESYAETKLKYLDLSNNNVTELSRLELDMISGLKVLKLTGNPLRRFEPYSVPNELTIDF